MSIQNIRKITLLRNKFAFIYPSAFIGPLTNFMHSTVASNLFIDFQRIPMPVHSYVKYSDENFQGEEVLPCGV
jgi:hypothetical protein